MHAHQNLPITTTPGRGRGFSRFHAALIACTLTLGACGGGGGGGGGVSSPVDTADDARRTVLADIGGEVILPAIEGFTPLAQQLQGALDSYAADLSSSNRDAARTAWASAMAAFSRIEVMQLGPAAADSEMGGENLRDLIYFWPSRNECLIDNAAYSNSAVDQNTRADSMGLGAIEYLLWFDGDNPNCPPGSGVNRNQARADHAARIAAFITTQATELQTSWQASGENFLGEFANAGAGSNTYSSPQDALDALSVALFYVEKQTKDSKIACPTGIGATGQVCTGNDVDRAEHPYARRSLTSMRANVQAFRDTFTGLDGGRGINDLLIGIDRQDLATEILSELDAVLNHLDTRIGPAVDGFESGVENISSANDCSNAAANPNGGAADPAVCSLHGLIKTAMDTFRGPIVAALSLKTPDSAAGDND